MADLTAPYTPSQIPQERILVPPNSTPLELDLIRAQQAITNLPVPYRTMFNPLECPASFLPWLAACWGADLWYSDWDEQTQRRFLANLFMNKRLKGTKQGIINYINYIIDPTNQQSSQLIKAVTPPATGFYVSGLTDAQFLQWLSILPQVRIYPYINVGGRIAPAHRAYFDIRNAASPIPPRSFYQDMNGTPALFWQTSNGPVEEENNAFFIDPEGSNSLVPCNLDIFTAVGDTIPTNVISIPTTPAQQSFYDTAGHPSTSFYGTTGTTDGHMFWQTSKAPQAIIQVQFNSNVSQLYGTFSGDQVFSVRPQRVNMSRVPPKGRGFWATGLTYGTYWLSDSERSGYTTRGFFKTSYGPNLIYNALYIFDPARTPSLNKTKWYWGNFQYGIGAYTAQMYIQIPITRPVSRMNTFWTSLQYWKPASLDPLYRTLDAIHLSKSERDKILVQPQMWYPVRLSSHTHLGSFKLGGTYSIAAPGYVG